MNSPKIMEALRLEISRAYRKYGVLSHPKVVELSQKLDCVLNDYRKMGSGNRNTHQRR